MRKICAILLGSLYVIVGFSQILTVKDITTNLPIRYANIMGDSSREFTITNYNGQADLSGFKNSKEITISVINYVSDTILFRSIENNEKLVFLEPRTISMNEMVVSAIRETKINHYLPQKSAKLDKQTIKFNNPQTSADLLGTSGEVFIQKSQQGGGSPMIRGFAANRLFYVVDGVRMNNAIFRSGNIQNILSINPLNIDSANVLFGPGSVLYGSGAIGGVMSFTTLSGKYNLKDSTIVKGRLLGRYSTVNNELSSHLNVSFSKNNFYSISSFSVNKFNSLKMGKYGPSDYLCNDFVSRINGKDTIIKNPNPLFQKPSAYSQLNLMQKFGYKLNDNIEILYGFHYSSSSNFDRYDRHLRRSNSIPVYAEWYYGPQKWLMNNLKIISSNDSVLYDQLVVTIAHQYFEESRITRNYNDNYRKIRKENVNALSGNIDLTKNISPKNVLTYGAEMIHNYVISTGQEEHIQFNTFSEINSRYPNSKWSSYGLYINDNVGITDKFSLQAGLRYSHYFLSAEFDTAFYPLSFNMTTLKNNAINGSIGAVYSINANSKILSNFSTGYRAPNVDDVGKIFDSEPGSVVVPNTNLKGEYAYNVDFGLIKKLGNNVNVNISSYYTFLTNALVRRDFQLNGLDSIMYDGEISQIQAIQNAAYAQIYGTFANIEITISPNLNLYSAINWQKGVEELNTGELSPSRHTAPVYGFTKIDYSYKNLKIQLRSNYNGAKKFEELPLGERSKSFIYALDQNNNPYTPAWYTIDFRGTFSFNNNMSINFAVENILDKRYKPYSSGIAAPGRNFLFSFNLEF